MARAVVIGCAQGLPVARLVAQFALWFQAAQQHQRRSLPHRPGAAASRSPRWRSQPIIGAPDALAKQIQQEFTARASERSASRVIVQQGGARRLHLRGYIVAAKDKNGTKVSYIWDVTRRDAASA